MKPMTEQHLAILRRHMVEVVDLHFDLAEEEIGKSALDPRLRTALLHVPRHIFVPAQIALSRNCTRHSLTIRNAARRR